MSSIDAQLRGPVYAGRSTSRTARSPAMAQTQTPIVPEHSIAGRALLGVIAIMSFLASLTLGAVTLVRNGAGDWQAQVSREVTIQIKPVEGHDIERQVARASLIAKASRGVAQARAYSKQESMKLLEPWLGAGLTLDELPVPRMIVVTLDSGARADLTRLRQALAEQVPGSSLDDHRGWVERMRAMTRTAVAIGLGVLGLMLVATMLLVGFATRGAMATNRGIVEILHFVGAKNRFIAGQFQRCFLMIGLKGAAFGGLAAAAVFLLVRSAAGQFDIAAGGEEIGALFGSLTLTPEGYAGIVGVVVLTAAVTAITSRWTVHRTLDSMD